jgi:hypothetical protein
MHPVGSSDSLRPVHVPTATPSSTESRRTDPGLATSPAYTASARTIDRTGDRPALPGFADLVARTHESNTEPVDSVGRPSAQSQRRTASRSSSCNCTIVIVDHFATFPEKLVEPCVLAGTSERGACAACGAPWVRVVERGDSSWSARKASGDPMRYGDDGAGQHQGRRSLLDDEHRNYSGLGVPASSKTTGWEPTCDCGTTAGHPCVVLDPFAGSGTVGVVCERLGRRFVGIELNPEYAAMAERRIAKHVMPLFAEVS